MTKYRRYCSFLVLASLCSLWACGHKKPSVPSDGEQAKPGEAYLTPKQIADNKIEVMPLAEHGLDDTILTGGKVQLEDLKVAHVFSPVTGRVIRIDAKLGQRVKKNDTLAIIESPDVGLASSDLRKAQADAIAAEHEFKRQKELRNQGATSQKDLEISEDNYRKTLAELERAKQKAALLRAGTINTGSVTQSFTLHSPIDGEIIARSINPGVEVQGQYGGSSAVELFTIGELDTVWVVADIFEMDLGRVKIGSKMFAEVVAYPKKIFECDADWFSGLLDPTTRTAKVRCTLPNPDKALKSEMFATIRIRVEEKKALAVPRAAIVRLGDSTFVFTEHGTAPNGKIRFERVPISVDESEGNNWIPILQGPPKGTRIVTAGAVLFSDMTQ